MKKIAIALAGILLCVFGLNLKNNIKQGEQIAVAKDKSNHGFGVIVSDNPQCKWSAHAPDRVMNQNRSQAILVKTSNPENKKCITMLSLRAPGFNLQPSKEEQQISLSPKKNGSISWIIIPKQTGTYDMTLTDQVDTKIFGVTVKNIYGLTAGQAKLLSNASSLFGPMLTIPWWLDWWRKKKTGTESEWSEVC